ncbi:LOW QUALITY PROTEIN: cathepsin O-like [Uloborus diversus]|uniref:LOW QUALITY PROTEIN: cathepsin O-like n=1 Tax=Uloborus diversus TaxID=327109 RepID=UPI00240A5F78|nr:LOW QUALITY PROTEIN: cathepsin O-like [Uloborus diversus]
MTWLAALHAVFSCCLLLFVVSYDETKTDVFQRFEDYIRKFNKSYHPGTVEFTKRESIFEQTLKRINWLNKNGNFTQSTVYGINQFSEMTPEEFIRYVHLAKVDVPADKLPKKSSLYPRSMKLRANRNIRDQLPQRVDWREKKVVTPVNNQEECGACWAFSTVETIETMYALKTGQLEQWSVQQVIDCAAKPDNGCEGGDTCLTINWLYEDKVKLVPAKDYPFDGKTGTCKEKVTSDTTVQVARNFTCDSFVGEEDLMLLHLAYHGPLIAAVDATGWQDYLGGIIQFHCDAERNHAVQIVGYDLKSDIPYYIVRNSWGTQFGNDGYLYIAIGKNMCRIAEEVSSVDVL